MAVPCGARARSRGGEPCRQPAKPNGRCRFHGGNSTGPKTLKAGGRYSKGLGKLAGEWQELMEAADLLDPAPGLALMDLAVNLRLGRGLEDGDSPGFRRQALDLFNRFCEATATTEQAMHGEPLALALQLRALLERGVAADRAVSDAMGIVERRTRTTARVMDLQLRAQASVPKATLSALLAVIGACISEHAPAESAAIFADCRSRMLGLSRRAGLALQLGQGAAVDAEGAVPAGPGGVCARGAGPEAVER